MFYYIKNIIKNNLSKSFFNLEGFIPKLPDSNRSISLQESLKTLIGKKIFSFPIDNINLQDCILKQFKEAR